MNPASRVWRSKANARIEVASHGSGISCTSEKLKIFGNGTNNRTITSADTQIERLQNECANLSAKKKIRENVQTRLIDENKVLSLERSGMTDLIVKVQKTDNDIDKANGSDEKIWKI
ncbi:hypothetical protein ACEPAG_3583 [Sanghuangporus baumii]